MPESGTTQTVEDWCLEALGTVNSSSAGDPLSDLTIVIPSRRRQDYLLRQIRFWWNSAPRLMIVDGSCRGLPDGVVTAVEGHPRIEYIHDERSMSDRLARAGQMIETRFAVMLGDDEFHLPSGLRASIAALEADPELIGCMGQVISFLPVRDYRAVSYRRNYRLMSGFEARGESPGERVDQAFRPYTMATCYAVLRSTAWKLSWGMVQEYGSGHAAEVQQAMAVHLLGGVSTTNHVQMLRSIENPTDPVADLEANGKIWFPQWWQEERFADERLRFVETLASIASDRLGQDLRACRRWVVEAAEGFVRWNAGEYAFDSTESLHEQRGRLVSIRGRVSQHLPTRLLRVLQEVRRKWRRWTRDWDPGDYGTILGLERYGPRDGLVVGPLQVGDLRIVEELVRAFHSQLRASRR